MKVSYSIFFLLFTNLICVAANAQCLDEENVYSFVYNGHSYEVVKENATWTEASLCAVGRNGYLAEINSELEQNAIFDELTNNADINILNTENQFGTASIWLGGTDAGVEGNWIWDGNNDAIGPPFWTGGPSGSPVGSIYTNWGISPAEPDNSGGQDHLTIIIKPTATNFGLWNDLVSTNLLYYLIEYDEVLSVYDSELNNNLSVYPNPVKDYLTIENSNADEILYVEVYNLAGQKIHTYLKNDFVDQSIDLQSLENGMYIFSVHFEGGVIADFRVVK